MNAPIVPQPHEPSQQKFIKGALASITVLHLSISVSVWGVFTWWYESWTIGLWLTIFGQGVLLAVYAVFGYRLGQLTLNRNAAPVTDQAKKVGRKGWSEKEFRDFVEKVYTPVEKLVADDGLTYDQALKRVGYIGVTSTYRKSRRRAELEGYIKGDTKLN